MKIEDITLLKELGSGGFGSVYLATKEGKKEHFAAKLLNRDRCDGEYKRYLLDEISILKELNHPNIYKIGDIKKTSKYYIMLTEYVNGGSLSDCLEKYKKYFHMPFTEEIVQYLMRQIIDAFKYIHAKGIMHRDVKLENIMVNFNNDNDKIQLNLLKSTVKIIDFGLAHRGLGKTIVGTKEYMPPFLLKKYANSIASQYCKPEKYDQKVDIWSLGATCYQMLIGKRVFSASSLSELVNLVEAGNYVVPTTLSREVVSFLNCMLQYDENKRLTAAQLSQHPFLTKNVRDFVRIDTKKASKKIDYKGMHMNIKKGLTIWSIFEDEKKLLKIGEGNKAKAQLRRANTLEPRLVSYSTGSGNIYSQIFNNENIAPAHSSQYVNNNNFNQSTPIIGNNNNNAKSFYGQDMHVNQPTHPNQGLRYCNTLNPNIMNNNLMMNQYIQGIGNQPNYGMNGGFNNNPNFISNNQFPQSQYRPMDNDDFEEQNVCNIM